MLTNAVFNYINENFLHPPSKDLSPASINILRDLMLAQAQECFIEKVVGFDGKKGALVSKLSQKCAEMYESILQALANVELKGQFESSWTELAKV